MVLRIDDVNLYEGFLNSDGCIYHLRWCVRSRSSTDDRRSKDRASDSCSGESLLVLGNPDTLLNDMLLEFVGFVFDDVVRVTRELFGNIRTTIGRRAGILTQMIPRLHSMTDKFKLGTLWSDHVSRPRSCNWRVEKQLTGNVQHSQVIQERNANYASYTSAEISLEQVLGVIERFTYPAPPIKRTQRTMRCLSGMSDRANGSAYLHDFLQDRLTQSPEVWYRQGTKDDVGKDVHCRTCIQIVDVVDARALSSEAPCP